MQSGEELGAGPAIVNVFVIMPFTETLTRTGAELTNFFEYDIKRPLEDQQFSSNPRYQVRRSDETFNITDQIVKDLYSADIVVADLSGEQGNPNVMYELGLRLAFSNKPVILIREGHAENRDIFDITGFHTEPYNPVNRQEATEYIKRKILRFQSGDEPYESPILQVLRRDVPLLMRMTRDRAAELLRALSISVVATLSRFGQLLKDFAEPADERIDLGDTVMVLAMKIDENRIALDGLDWSAFDFRLTGLPTVDLAVAQPYLASDLLPLDVGAMFRNFIFKYHAEFLATDAYWRNWVAPKALYFAGESLILATIARALADMLSADDPSAKASGEQLFRSQIATSRFAV